VALVKFLETDSKLDSLKFVKILSNDLVKFKNYHAELKAEAKHRGLI